MLRATLRAAAFVVLVTMAVFLVPPIPVRGEQEIRVSVDGRWLTFDVPPRIVNGRTLVPLRAIFEALGAAVSWDGATRTVRATLGARVVELAIGGSTARVGAQTVSLDVPAQIVDGRTLVPLRFVSEALGAQVAWDGVARTVTVASAGGGGGGGGGGPAGPDSDHDGLADAVEMPFGLDPQNPDSDGDGVPDGQEPQGLKDLDRDGLVGALDPDADGDGLADGVEDADRDGALDAGETDPTSPDTDGDGLADGAEDADGDGAVDPGETDPTDPDTDGDGLGDGAEPHPVADVDGDGLVNARDADSDGEGLGDGREVALGCGPENPNSDDDGVTDGAEVAGGTDPKSPDTDGDGLLDGQEAVSGAGGLAFWAEAESLAPAAQRVADAGANHEWAAGPGAGAAAGAVLSGQPFGTVPSGQYRVYLRLKATSSAGRTPQVTVQAQGDAALNQTFPLPYCTVMAAAGGLLPPPGRIPPGGQLPQLQEKVVNIYRFYATSAFACAGRQPLSLTVTCPAGDTVLCDRLLLARADYPAFTTGSGGAGGAGGGRALPRALTDPLCADTDGDGSSDGDEMPVPSWWWQAENIRAAGAVVLPHPQAANGASAVARADGGLCQVAPAGVMARPTGSTRTRTTTAWPTGLRTGTTTAWSAPARRTRATRTPTATGSSTGARPAPRPSAAR